MMRTGETYRCTDAQCRCEIQVLRGSESRDGTAPPRCCCGREMILQSRGPSAVEGEARPA
jgi:hypothetical protein